MTPETVSKIVLRIPTPMFEKLRAQAKRNRRSINSEMLALIEQGFLREKKAR